MLIDWLAFAEPVLLFPTGVLGMWLRPSRVCPIDWL